jgi:hypothetical protein
VHMGGGCMCISSFFVEFCQVQLAALSHCLVLISGGFYNSHTQSFLQSTRKN